MGVQETQTGFFLFFFFNQSLFFPFVFIKLNEKLHCPKFFNMETFKTIL